jgi:hypothetical protein
MSNFTRAAFALVCALSSGAFALDWQTERIDDPSSSQPGSFSSMLLPNDVPHVFYFQGGSGVRAARRTADSWDLGPSIFAGVSPATVDDQGRIHVLTTGQEPVWISDYGGPNQTEHPLSRPLSDATIAIDAQGRAHVAGWTSTSGGMDYFYWNGTGWRSNYGTLPDSLWRPERGYTNRYLALDSNGIPHIAYTKGDGWLVYGRFSAHPGTQDPRFFTSAIPAANQANSPSIVIGSDDKPRIAFGQRGNGGDLMYARITEAGWSIVPVDTAADANANVSASVSLALDALDRPHISYNGGGTVKYATLTETGWLRDVVDEENWTGAFNTSIAIDSTGVPHISYLTITTSGPQQRYFPTHATLIPEPFTFSLIAPLALVLTRPRRRSCHSGHAG